MGEQPNGSQSPNETPTRLEQTLSDSDLGLDSKDEEDQTDRLPPSRSQGSREHTSSLPTEPMEGSTPSVLPATLVPPDEGITTELQHEAQAAVSGEATEMLDGSTRRRNEGAPTRHLSQQGPTVPALDNSPDCRFPPIAGYHILSELGRGGMGVVYKARQPGLNRVVALKMVLSGKLASRSELERFGLEAEVIAKLRHPNIIQIYEIGKHDGTPYFSLEYVEGGCLAERVDLGTPPPDQAARIVQALAEAMDTAHCQGIIHRDLKPANILLQGKPGAPLEECVPKITDFGLARQLETDSRKTRQGAVMGTPSYMPPEQAEGKTWQLGPPADIYSLGAILYDLLTGKPPFNGKSVVDTIQMVISREPRAPIEINPTIPRDLQTICLKCLEKDPAKRYRSARDLAEDLQAYLQGEPIKARPSGMWERSWKWARRRPALAALILVGLLSLVGFGVGAALYARQQSALAQEEESRRQLAEESRLQAEQLAKQETQLRTSEEERRRQAEVHASQERRLRQLAERERTRAQDNFQQAREAVRELTDFGQRRLSSEPHMEVVRRELLEKALAFHQRFLEINGDSASQRQEVGRAQLRVSEIQELLGRRHDAEKACRAALKTFQSLKDDDPMNPQFRQDLAATCSNLATLLQAADRLEEAVGAFAQALAIKRKLHADFPQDSAYRRDLANSYNNRGNLWQSRKKFKEAEDDYSQALQLLSGLSPEGYLEDLAKTHDYLATLWMQRQPARAPEAFEQAIQGWTALSKSAARNPRYRRHLASAYLNRGTLAHMQGNHDNAEEDYKKATEILSPLTDQFNNVLDYRELLANTQHNHGQLLRERKRFGDAAEVWREAISLWERLARDLPDKSDYRQKLGQSYNELALALASANRLGEVEELWSKAIDIQEKLVRDHPREAAYWQDLVNSCANQVSLLLAVSPTMKAEKACRKLVEVQQRRDQAFPGVPVYQRELALAHYNLGRLLFQLNRGKDARQSVADAVRIQRTLATRKPALEADSQALRDYSFTRIELFLQDGLHVEASVAVGELLAVLPEGVAPEQAGLFLARCMTAAMKDTTLDEEQRREAMTMLGDQAMTLLRKAVDQGFKEVQALKTLPEWEPLRSRDDFQKLLVKLEKK